MIYVLEGVDQLIRFLISFSVVMYLIFALLCFSENVGFMDVPMNELCLNLIQLVAS